MQDSIYLAFFFVNLQRRPSEKGGWHGDDMQGDNNN